MSGDVRSLEEVIAARLDKIFAFDYGNADALIEFDETQDLSTHIAAAVREWCRERGVNLDDLEKHGDGGE